MDDSSSPCSSTRKLCSMSVAQSHTSTTMFDNGMSVTASSEGATVTSCSLITIPHTSTIEMITSHTMTTTCTSAAEVTVLCWRFAHYVHVYCRRFDHYIHVHCRRFDHYIHVHC